MDSKEMNVDNKIPEMENQLESIILSLADSFTNESVTRNAAFVDSLHQRFDENEELYETEITLAFLNFTEFAAMPWLAKNEVKDEKNWSIIHYIYNGIFPHFVKRTIVKNEGSACSGDKEHFILKKVKEAITTGKNQSLYATYEGCERIDRERWHEQAYWSPRSFKDTDEVMERFWRWYKIED